MPWMHAWHFQFHKSMLYNDIGLLQRIIKMIEVFLKGYLFFSLEHKITTL